MSDPIKITNVQKEDGEHEPSGDRPAGGDNAAEEITDVNQEMDQVFGRDPADGDKPLDTGGEDTDPADSIDDHMPADSESVEDKVQDILNSGILRM